MPQPDTKQRILTIAGELFAGQGYTGTAIADIAGELGTTTAALYLPLPVQGGDPRRPARRAADGLHSPARQP
jgi:Bacterial regulatory proteins, tetR family